MESMKSKVDGDSRRNRKGNRGNGVLKNVFSLVEVSIWKTFHWLPFANAFSFQNEGKLKQKTELLKVKRKKSWEREDKKEKERTRLFFCVFISMSAQVILESVVPEWGRSLFVIVILFKWQLEGNFFSVLFIYFGFMKIDYFMQHFYIFYLTFCWKLWIWIMNKRMKKQYHENAKRTWAKFNMCICKNSPHPPAKK